MWWSTQQLNTFTAILLNLIICLRIHPCLFVCLLVGLSAGSHNYNYRKDFYETWIENGSRSRIDPIQFWRRYGSRNFFLIFFTIFFFFLHFSTFFYVSFRILLKHFSCIQVAGIYGWEQFDVDKGNCWALMEVCALHLSYILCLWLPRCGQKINQCSFNWLFPVPSLLEQQFSSFPREPMGRSCIPNVHLFK